MVFNPSEFHKRVRDIYRPEYFLVSFPEAFNDSETLTILTESTSKPGRSIDAIEVPVQGLDIKLAGKITFDEWTCTFRAERLSRIRNVFLKWNSICVNVLDMGRGLPEEYKHNTAYVAQLTPDGDVISSTTFYGLWPREIGEITLGHGEDAPATFDVTFAYDFHQDKDPESSNLSIDIDIDAGGVMLGSDLDTDVSTRLENGFGTFSLGV